MTDADLLTCCLAHDRAAWNQLVERFSGLVYSVIHHTLARHHVPADESLVDDLFGGAFLALYDSDYRRLRQWRGGCSLASWIRLIVANTVVDQLRKRRPEVPHADPETTRDSRARTQLAPDATELLNRADRIAQVRVALQDLSAGDRELLVELYVNDVAPGVLASLMGVRAGTLYTRKNRALARLRSILGEDL